MKMNLMIFGAGASHGSDYLDPLPPLGDKLLDELTIFAPDSWGRLPKKYKDACRTDFEQGIKLLSEEQSLSLSPLHRAMAAYFFHFRPRITNLYCRLGNLIKLSNWNMMGSLVTFNYERLLQMCLTASNLQPAVGVEKISDNQIELCLPHGTCNLFCAGIQALGNIAFTGLSVSFDGGGVEQIIDPFKFQQHVTRDAIPPIMSYFEPQKRNPSGTSFISSQRKRYEELVLTSSKIAIIGLKVRPFDTHIWDPLANTQAEIVYCAGERGAAEFNDWAKKNREGNNKILNGYFTDCFDTICSELEIT